MARASRRSTTRTATLRRTRWRSSSRRWTSVWTNICGGSTRAMSRKPRQTARAQRTSRKRSKRCPRSAGVDQEVTNQVVDMGLLTQTAEPARTILEVETIDVVADRGYFKIEDIEACEKAGMTPYVPKPQRGSSVRNGFFRKDEFRYDAELDVCICPAGQVLSTRYESKLRELTKVDYSNAALCLVCAIKSRCTKDYRKVSRLENEAVLDRMAARLKARPEILDRRRERGQA